jgi:hypothetical protein
VNRIAENPFYVLEVRPGATETEIERAGQKLLAMLAVGLDQAKTYPSPAGERPRDTELVRRAIDELRNPEKRWMHELWARLPPSPVPPAAEPADPWPEALASLGYRARSRG